LPFGENINLRNPTIIDRAIKAKIKVAAMVKSVEKIITPII
jgi:hypothetical protein